jgi:hypothetical protein
VVDVCLIPEIQFTLEKLTAHVRSVLENKDYCVVCVAEGVTWGGGGGGEGAWWEAVDMGGGRGGQRGPAA